MVLYGPSIIAIHYQKLSIIKNEIVRFKATEWIILKPTYSSKILSKKSKIDHRLNLMQEVKAKIFLKLDVQE